MRDKTKNPATNGTRPIRTLWFDLGNVILPFDFTPAFRRLSRYGAASPADLRRFFKDRPWLEADCDEGRVHGYQLYRLLKKNLGMDGLSYRQFKHVWNDIFAENGRVSNLIRRLKKGGYRLILISNTNKLHFDYLIKKYGVLRLFDRHILSFKVKTRKPHRRIYRAALKASRAKAGEIFYTDDREELVRTAARDHGVVTHTFRSAARLRNELLKQGIAL